jgi:hypothetical protein
LAESSVLSHTSAAVATGCGGPAGPVVTADAPEAHVVLAPEISFRSDQPDSDRPQFDRTDEQHRQLALQIRQRIESRLGGRVRDLSVRCVGDTVVLEGSCATYYTKQLAQHAALGVLEQEQLENEIIVAVPR